LAFSALQDKANADNMQDSLPTRQRYHAMADKTLIDTQLKDKQSTRRGFLKSALMLGGAMTLVAATTSAVFAADDTAASEDKAKAKKGKGKKKGKKKAKKGEDHEGHDGHAN
jgi:hypothetical protein